MTQAQLYAAVKAISPDLTCRKVEGGEYRVSINPAVFIADGMDTVRANGKAEAVAYYADDRQDALDTAHAMARNYVLTPGTKGYGE